MVLTEEQKERIRRNKERALRIQKERRQEKRKNESNQKTKDKSEEELRPLKRQKMTDCSIVAMPRSISCKSTVTTDYYHSDAPLEDFEEGASEWITKKEAMTMYCLPEGTMAVCSCEEKENPRNPLFKPMKLFMRSEIRYRSHKRHGGLEGLVKERNKRRNRKLEKEMAEAREIFTRE